MSANHNYEKSSISFCFARCLNFDFVCGKSQLKVKNHFASRASKKSSRHTICKAFCSGATEKKLGFAGLGRIVRIIMEPKSSPLLIVCCVAHLYHRISTELFCFTLSSHGECERTVETGHALSLRFVRSGFASIAPLRKMPKPCFFDLNAALPEILF